MYNSCILNIPMFDLFQEKFLKGHFSEIISLSTLNGITPETDPYASQVLAAAHFSLGQYEDALELLQGLEPTLGNEESFLSLYGATFRRMGNLVASDHIFSRSLALFPENEIIKNNYANLLVDMKKYPEALAILTEVVSNSPDYQDALDNLRRLNSLIEASKELNSIPSHVSASHQITDVSPKKSLDTLLDPLLMAFHTDEVSAYGRLKSLSGLKTITDEPDVQAIGLEKLKLAQTAVSENNPAFALKLCSQAYQHLGCEAVIFNCASDAYLGLNRFLDAEIMTLHSISISGASIKDYINLVSFASMRCDFILAEFYLEKAMCLDSSHASLPQLRQLLYERKRTQENSRFLFENEFPSLSLQLES